MKLDWMSSRVSSCLVVGGFGVLRRGTCVCLTRDTAWEGNGREAMAVRERWYGGERADSWREDLLAWFHAQPGWSERGAGEWIGRVLTLAFAVLAVAGYIPWERAPWLVAFTVALSALLALTAAPVVVAYAGIWFGFTALRGWVDDLGAPLRGSDVAAIDRWPGGVLPSQRLQDALAGISGVELLDRAMIAVHLSYFVVPHLAALWLWWRGVREGQGSHLRHYLIALALLMGFGLLLHALVPTEPPWMLAASDGQPEVRRLVSGRDASSSVTIGADGQLYGSFTDRNPVAAMPSLHLGISLAMALVLLPLRRWIGILSLAYAAVMGFALVYLAEHYLVDVIVGGVLAVVSVWIASHLIDSSWLQGAGIVPLRWESRADRASAGSHKGWVESGD